ncbi:ATP phosphoribosyltransferase [Nocardia sp. GAS34]|uniref:ATP phosphoribosyltransferase n=1 Tax=unclassified Nocardia TaxID=2637762 RepID=UPI003D1C321F
MRLAVPGGRLWDRSRALLADLDVTTADARTRRRYVFDRPAGDLQCLVLKIPDIAAAVGDGLVDLAVASDEWLLERDIRYTSLIPLCWYHIRVALLVPEHSVPGAGPWSVATPYPRLAADMLDPDRFRIREVVGAVEAYPGQLTDLAIDCVETGTTAASNGLTIARELLRADVRLVAGPNTDITTAVAREVLSVAARHAVRAQCSFADDGQAVSVR